MQIKHPQTTITAGLRQASMPICDRPVSVTIFPRIPESYVGFLALILRCNRGHFDRLIFTTEYTPTAY